jgi:Tfp pilus assembly protein PilX
VSSFATRLRELTNARLGPLNSEGMVLATCLTILSVLLALGIGIRVMVQNDYRILANLRSSTHSFYYSVAGIEWSKHEIAELDIFPPAPANQMQSFANGAFDVRFSLPAVTGPLAARLTVRSTGAVDNATHVIEAQLTKAYELSDAALAVRGNPARAVLSGGEILISGTDHDQTNGTLRSGAKPRLAISASSEIVRGLLSQSIENPEILDRASLAPLVGQSDYLPASFLNQLAGDLCSVPRALLHPISTTGSLTVSNQIWGSQSSPEVHCVDGLSASGDSINISGDVSGAGILVVRNADLVLSGSFHWQGLIVVNGQEVGLRTAGSSTKEIVGAVVLNETGAPPSTTAIMEIQGNLRLLFSREALKTAAELIPATTLTSAYGSLPFLVTQNYWRNVAQ